MNEQFTTIAELLNDWCKTSNAVFLARFLGLGSPFDEIGFIFLQFKRRLDHGEVPGDLRQWVFGLAEFYLRHAATANRCNSCPAVASEPIYEEPEPMDSADFFQFQRVSSAMRDLPGNLKTPIAVSIGIDQECQTIAELARKCGTPESTLRDHARRGLRILKQQLGRHL